MTNKYTVPDFRDLQSPYNIVTLPPGMTESKFMDKIENAKGWNNWIWIPWINDCHSDLSNAFKQAGVSYPGAPNGRVDADDQLSAFFDKLNGWLRNPSILGY